MAPAEPGPAGADLWAWLVTENDGRDGIIAVLIPNRFDLGPTPLVTTRERVARELYREPAIAHGEASGRPIKLVRYVATDTFEAHP